MIKKITLLGLAVMVIVSTITVVILQKNNIIHISPQKYNEYTPYHSLIRKYNDKDYEKALELITAIADKDQKKVDKLLNSKMEFNCPELYQCYDGAITTPLGMALMWGDNETAYKLLEKGAVITKFKDSESILSCLVCSYEKGDLEMAKLLIEKGASPNDHGDIGLPPIFQLVNLTFFEEKYQPEDYKEIIEIFELFEREGVNINETYGGYTILMQAARANDLALLKYLVEKRGMAVNDVVQDSEMISTALITAVQFSDLSFADPQVVKYLLDQGADKTMTDVIGRTALDWAIIVENQEAIDLLK